VTKWDPVQPRHVRQAVAEYDQLGQDEFLARHGFGRAQVYLLILDDKSYDSKAILCVAYGYATGRPLGPHDFSGGVHGAAGVLSALGFEIVNTRDHDPPGSC
jgi:5-methylcytosine-specific restriction protein A